MTLYDEVEYPSRSFSQTHPERAAAIGTLLGMSPPPPSTCRVLEVGCGSGWNLIPMAAALPEAEIFGFDLAASAIEAGQRDAEALGLRNLKFEHLDLMEFPAGSGPFDYIIAHGFYSWVPAPVRLRLLELCRERLSPQGLAFISFNAKPFAKLRLMWREMMQYHCDLIGAANPSERLAESAALLKILRDQWSRTRRLSAHAKLLDVQIESIQSGGGNWFFHDDLGPFFETFSISEFSREVGGYGLQFAAEALFDNLNPETTGADWIAREQTWDHLAFRGFHSALVCHGSVELQRPAAAFERLRYAAPLTRVSEAIFRNDWTKGEAESTDPPTVDVLQRLGSTWPGCLEFGELGLEIDVVQQLSAAGVIEPCVSPRLIKRPSLSVTAAPKVWAPARLQARRGKVVTNRFHAAIQLEQEPLRKLAIGLDGTRALLEFEHLFPSQRVMLEQVEWLHRAALLD